MHEIEIKFQVDRARRARVAAEVAGPRPARRVHLQAAYFDTADRALAQARIALRVRREGRRWVQTLKGAADDGMTRFEHNVDLPAGAAAPVADPALHDGTEVGRRLARILDASPGGLVCLYRTDVWRRTRRVRGRLGTVELAFDDGRILAGDASLPLCELEIELVTGSPMAVIDAARRWSARHGLGYDTRSKSERGDMLARGVTVAPPRRAGPVVLDASMTLAEAERAVLRSCLDQVAVNASQVAAGGFGDEHVHQLRVGLRRLRTALRFFGRDPASPITAGADALFRALGASRDRSATAAIEADVRWAMDAAGVALPTPRLSADDPPGDPASLVREPAAQALLLDLLAAAQGVETIGADEPADALRQQVADRLKRLHRHLAAGVRGFDDLDDAGRHHLRRQAKRLRYAVEFSRALFGRKRVARYLKTLRTLQRRLGEATDVSMALAQARLRAGDDLSVAFAAGWLAARHDHLIDACRPALARFAEAERFWRR